MRDDSSQPTSRTIIGTVVLLACCLLSLARIIFNTTNPSHIKPDQVSARSDQRFALLKKKLPSEGIVGYVGETGDSSLSDYYLTQYALAPLVIDDTPNHQIVVGNFPSSKRANIPSNLTLIEDFGNGVLLYAARETK